jgi:hypothetical protein
MRDKGEGNATAGHAVARVADDDGDVRVEVKGGAHRLGVKAGRAVEGVNGDDEGKLLAGGTEKVKDDPVPRGRHPLLRHHRSEPLPVCSCA